ncbi:MAG: hypothetical protein NVS1B6_06360 [Steroidobacteraceae bacterium]
MKPANPPPSPEPIGSHLEDYALRMIASGKRVSEWITPEGAQAILDQRAALGIKVVA